jgi:hypothetical protein
MSQQECIICLDTIFKKDEYKNPCQHCKDIYFHRGCWNLYQQNTNSQRCPSCNLEYTQRVENYPFIRNIHYHIYHVEQMNIQIEPIHISRVLTPLEISNEEYKFYRKIITLQIIADVSSLCFFLQIVYTHFRDQFLFGLYLIAMIDNFICFSLQKGHCLPLYEQFLIVCQYMVRAIMCLYTFMDFKNQKENIGLWIQISVFFYDIISMIIFYHLIHQHSSIYQRWFMRNQVTPIQIEDV